MLLLINTLQWFLQRRTSRTGAVPVVAGLAAHRREPRMSTPSPKAVSIDARHAPRRAQARSRHRTARRALRADRRSRCVPRAVSRRAARGRVRAGVQQGHRLLLRVAQGPGRVVRDQAHAPDRRDRRAAERGVRAGGVVVHREVRVPGQGTAHDADRPAVLRLAGDLRPDLRADVRRARLVRPVAHLRTTCRSSSPCRASCSRRSSSRSRSSRAS